MPNWCSNNVTFTHSDPVQLQRLVTAFNEERLFREFMPVPEELANTQAPNDNGDNAEELIQKYGAPDWYSWAVENWGTKWDVSSTQSASVLGDTASVYFDTAWSPPTAFYRFMEEQGFTVDAYYYEPGMAFCGHYVNGEDAEFMIPGTSAEAADQIPSDIDEQFDIVNSMAMWEEESKEDV